MKCIIIDDEPLAREQLSEELNGFESIEIIGSFGNATKALDFTKNNHVDLVFLDIEMPGMTGLELAAFLKENSVGLYMLPVLGSVRTGRLASAVAASMRMSFPSCTLQCMARSPASLHTKARSDSLR